MAKTKAKAGGKPIDCGIVMPISEVDGLSESHWFQVRRVIKSAVLSVGFKGRLVSDSDGANVIVSNIIQNLFFDPIVVCDVSCKNANVMFELGLRLAFDRPVVIIMDNITKFTFDVSMLQHIIYPRDLRYHSIISFKEELAEKVKATYEDSAKADYKSFLKHFERLTPSAIGSKDIPQFDFLIGKIEELGVRISSLSKPQDDIAIHRSDSFNEKQHIYTVNRIKQELLEFSSKNETMSVSQKEDMKNTLLKYLLHRGLYDGVSKQTLESILTRYFERVFHEFLKDGKIKKFIPF